MRVLIVSHNSFSKISNNGKTLEAIFSSFPSAQLAQLYFSNLESPDYEYCHNYFKVTDMDVLKSLAGFGLFSGGGVPGREGVSKAGAGQVFNFLKKLFRKNNFLRDLLWATGRWRSEKLFSWIDKFSPDAIFYLGGGALFSHKIAVELQAYVGKPLVTYFTDDYIIYPQSSGLRSSLYQKLLKSRYHKTVGKSSLLFVIGEEMAKEYSTYFDREFHHIMNAVDDCEYFAPACNEVLQVSYFGGLHLGRWRMISRFAESLKGIVEVNVYSASELESEISEDFSKSGVIFQGAVGSDVIHDKMLLSDMLLHVESDELEYRNVTKLSVSTKIPEYLISGRPVIAYGPQELASMKVIIQNDVGVFVSSCLEDKEIHQLLEDFVNSSAARRDAGLRAYNYARNNFLKEVVSERFKKKMYSLNN